MLVTTINAYNATTLWQQTCTSPMYSDSEPHVVTIKKVGSGRIAWTPSRSRITFGGGLLTYAPDT